MFARLVGESFIRNPHRKLLTAAALAAGMAVTTACLMMALDVGDRLAREFRSLGANLLVTSQSDTLALEIGGVDYRPVDEGAYLNEADLGKLKTIFWRHNIIGFTPFLDVPVQAHLDAGSLSSSASSVTAANIPTTLVGTWYQHPVPVPDGTKFETGVRLTHPWWTIRGRWFNDGAHECVVGAGLAESFPGGVALGATLSLQLANGQGSSAAGQAIPLLVTGIVTTGDVDDDSIVAPLAVAQELSTRPGQFRQLFVSALTKPEDAFSQRNPATMTPTEYDRWFCSPYISSIGHQIQQVMPGTEARPIRRVAETEGRVLSRVSSLLWMVTLAALIGAALAVAATAATTVLDRRSEVGLMKALGAPNSLVAGIFLAEQVLLACIGGAIGFLVGALLARLLGEKIFGTAAEMRPVLFPVVLTIAALVAVVGSLIPLRRASHFDPATILRGE
jgi:putative ABC transport system permease protein